MDASPGPRGDDVRIGTDPAEFDLEWVVLALSERAYWARGRPRELIVASLANSLCYGLFHGRDQVGVARVVTDRATFGWLCDVFVDEAWRGRGLGGRLIDAVVADPRLRDVPRLVLATRDAGELYERHGGFQPLAAPERWMERDRRGIVSHEEP
ncbi:MAG TPA: GNAT family N-acetyltransferase [Candidatus Limnocylindria bacterium]|nr:GNAT family N-acetyltransferase [Candidatus Limnocylindria bacterium]